MDFKLFGYARVSTLNQNLDRQIDLLREYGVAEEDIFSDKISGALDSRPAYDTLKTVVRKGDLVIVESLSRLSRSTKELLNQLEAWEAQGVGFISLKENFDATTPTGRAMIAIMASISQLEKEMIRDRVSQGLQAARIRGRLGGRPNKDKKVIEKALKMYDAKTWTITDICNEVGVSRSTLYRYINKRNS